MPTLTLRRVGALLALLTAALWVVAGGEAQQPDPKAPPAAKKSSGKKRVRVEEVEDPATGKGKQPRRVEEKVDTSKKPKKVITVEDDPDEAAGGGNDSGELAAAGRKMKSAGARSLLRELSRPYDLVTYNQGINTALPPRQEMVRPIAHYVGADPTKTVNQPIRVKGLDKSETFTITVTVQDSSRHSNVNSVRAYEEIVRDSVSRFLAAGRGAAPGTPNYVEPAERLAAAEAALAFAIRFQESARDTGEREDSEDWRRVESGLRQQLLDVMVEQLGQLAERNDWNGAFNLTRRLVSSYPGEEDQKKIARPLAEFIDQAFKSGLNTPEDTRDAVRRLRELAGQFRPDNELIRPLTDSITRQAQRLFDAAKEKAKDPKDGKALAEARDLAAEAAELRPDLAGLRTFQQEVAQRHLILRVGVRGLPRLMSPALACTDSDRRAVELMFEGLLKFTVDRAGNGRYEPALSEGRPRVVPLGRVLQLSRNAYWHNNTPVTAFDVRKSVDLLKEGRGTGRSAAWGDLLGGFEVLGDPSLVRVPLRQGCLDPRSLLTFKVVPGSAQPDPDDPRFAQRPVGSGPYRLDPDTKSEKGFDCVAFVANPAYAARRDRGGEPYIHEIRFFDYGYRDEDAQAALTRQSAPLDVLLDLTAGQAAALRLAGPRLGLEVPRPVESRRPNLRVYFLAVNHRTPALAHQELRQAIARAVNREELLDRHFREHPPKDSAPLLDHLHESLNGPYPAGSWACDPDAGRPRNKAKDNSLDLFDPELAKAQLSAVPEGVRPKQPLRLLYSNEDPAVDAAMKHLAEQVEKVLGFGLKREALRPEELRRRVEEENSYDLAYYSYDFPDETYWLWPLLAPTGPRGRANYLGTVGDGFQQLFQEAAGLRDFEQVRKVTRVIHLQLCNQMPVIPLWQLDPLYAVPARSRLEAPGLDGRLVFTDVERWRLQPRAQGD